MNIQALIMRVAAKSKPVSAGVAAVPSSSGNTAKMKIKRTFSYLPASLFQTDSVNAAQNDPLQTNVSEDSFIDIFNNTDQTFFGA